MATHELVVPRSMPMTRSGMGRTYFIPLLFSEPRGFFVGLAALIVGKQFERRLHRLEDAVELLLVVVADVPAEVAIGMELLRQVEVGALDLARVRARLDLE